MRLQQQASLARGNAARSASRQRPSHAGATFLCYTRCENMAASGADRTAMRQRAIGPAGPTQIADVIPRSGGSGARRAESMTTGHEAIEMSTDAFPLLG